MNTPMQLAFQKLMMQQQERLQDDPISAGTLAGMNSAKRTLGMNSQERERAIGRGMVKGASTMHNHGLQPGERPRGVFAMLADSLEPSMEAYRGFENQTKEINARMLAHQLEREDKTRGEQRELAKIGYSMEHDMRKEEHDLRKEAFDERKLTHEMNRDSAKETYEKSYKDRYLKILGDKNKILKEKSETKSGASKAEEIAPGVVMFNGKPTDVSLYPKMSTNAQRNRYSNDDKYWTSASNELESLKDTFDKLKKETEKNTFATFGSILGPVPNIAKDWLLKGGLAINAKHPKFQEPLGRLSKEVILRSDFLSKLEQIKPVLEKANKGGAADVQLMKRFNDLEVYASKNHPIPLIEDRLKSLLKHGAERKEASHLAVVSDRQVNDLRDIQQPDIDEEPNVDGQLGEAELNAVLEVRQKMPQASQLSDEEILKWLSEGGREKLAAMQQQGQQ